MMPWQNSNTNASQNMEVYALVMILCRMSAIRTVEMAYKLYTVSKLAFCVGHDYAIKFAAPEYAREIITKNTEQLAY